MANNAGTLYPGSFTQAEVCSSGDVSLTPGVYTKIGEYKVQADEAVGIGRGSYSSQDTAIGRLIANFKNSTGTAILTGKFRIMLVSSQDIPIGNKPVYIDVDLNQLTNGATNPAERYVLPFDGVLLTKDKKFQFFICNTTSAAVTLDADESSVLMDITRMLV